MTQSTRFSELSTEILQKFENSIKDLENPNSEHINTVLFLLYGKAAQIFNYQFLNQTSETIQMLPEIYQNELMQCIKTKGITYSMTISRDIVINLLKDYQKYIEQITNLYDEQQNLINSQQKQNNEQSQVLFQSKDDIKKAFKQIEGFIQYNNQMYKILSEFQSYQQNGNQDLYEQIQEACDELFEEKQDDIEYESDLSELDEDIPKGLPQFDELQNALDGKLDPEETGKYYCLQSINALGVKSLGPLPILLRIKDTSILDELNTDYMDEEIKKVFTNIDDYFPEVDDRHQTAEEILYGYASEFLNCLGIDIKGQDLIAMMQSGIKQICNHYKQETGKSISEEEFLKNMNTIQDYFVNNINQIERQRNESIARITHREQQQASQRLQRFKEIIQAGNYLLDAVINWINNFNLSNQN